MSRLPQPAPSRCASSLPISYQHQEQQQLLYNDEEELSDDATSDWLDDEDTEQRHRYGSLCLKSADALHSNSISDLLRHRPWTSLFYIALAVFAVFSLFFLFLFRHQSGLIDSSSPSVSSVGVDRAHASLKFFSRRANDNYDDDRHSHKHHRDDDEDGQDDKDKIILLPPANPSPRRASPRSSSPGDDSHAAASPPSPQYFDWIWKGEGRCDAILAAIEYHASNISLRDRSYKYREIAASMPRFYRGLDHLFLQDVFHLQAIPNPWFTHSNALTRTIVNADLHMFNVGSFDNSRAQIVYDLNDFDQSFIGDYHLDLWRTSTSIVIHMDVNHIMDPATRSAILRSYARTYVETLRSFIDNDDELSSSAIVTNATAHGAVIGELNDIQRNQNRAVMLEAFCYFDASGIRRLDISRPDLEPVPADRQVELLRHLPDYVRSLGKCRRSSHRTPDWRASWQRANTTRAAYYTVKSVAARIGAGLGSLGEPRYYVLIEGPSSSQDDDVMLDIKREPIPEWWQFVHADIRAANSVFESEAHRTCCAIHALGLHVDPDVGYMEMDDGAYIVRTRSPYKGAVDIDGLVQAQEYQEFTDSLAYITAVSHARSDNDYNADFVPHSFEAALISAIGDDFESFADAIESFANENTERVTNDFKCFIESGLADSVQRLSMLDKRK